MLCMVLSSLLSIMEAYKVILLVGLMSMKLQGTPSKQDWIATVQCLPHYHFNDMGKLIKISIFFSQYDDPASSYNVTFSDSVTGITCDNNTIPISSCDRGNKKCKHQLYVSNSSCSNLTSINVTISMTISEKLWTSKSIKIDSINNFVKVSFDKEHSSIRCTFLKEPMTSKKSCIVNYGQYTSQGCNDLSLRTEGHLFNSKSISLQLDLTSKICFVVIATEMNTTVNVEGVYHTVVTDPSRYGVLEDNINRNLFRLGVIILIVLLIIAFRLLLSHFKRRRYRLSATKSHEETLQQEKYYGEEDLEYSIQKTADDLPKKDQLLIDESTTLYKLWDVDTTCLMYKYAKEHYPGYQPQDGFGYYQETEVESIKLHKKVILMDEKIPRYIVYPATIKEKIIEGWKQVYAQDRSFKRTLDPGSKFLFCARSKLVTAYWRLYGVTEECKQSEFTLENVPGYSSDWMQYCYFELTKPEYIQPNQHVLVMKMDDKLWLGPGIRHLLGTGDGSKLTQKPDFSKFPYWKFIFVQSRDFNRNLNPGTKYLFCAKMDRVRAHYNIFIVKKKCKMAEFGKCHIPGYKPEYGYGYFEFTVDEYFKPHKKVILVRQDKKLYTGAGAQFICADGQYDKEIIEREKKISPPSLKGTEWKHIFIQSHSKTRELLPGTRFLYCEYKTYK